MQVCTVVPPLYYRFHPKPFGFGGVTENPSATPKVIHAYNKQTSDQKILIELSIYKTSKPNYAMGSNSYFSVHSWNSLNTPALQQGHTIS